MLLYIEGTKIRIKTKCTPNFKSCGNPIINVKMPTIVGILMFMSRKIAFWAYLSLKIAELLDIFILMSI